MAEVLETTELAALELTLQRYFDGLHDSDVVLLADAFHPFAHLYSLGADGQAADLPLADWLAVVATRVGNPKGDRLDRIVTLDFSGPATAFAKVQCQLPPRYFSDYLTLLKIDNRWRIIAKTFHAELREPR